MRDEELGTADWRWNEEAMAHVPCCRMGDGYGQTCETRLHTSEQIITGDCGYHNQLLTVRTIEDGVAGVDWRYDRPTDE